MSARTDTAFGFDPWSTQFAAWPYDAYARLREESPLTWFEPTQQWLVARHDDVSALVRDRRLGRTYLHRFTHEEMGRPEEPAETAGFWYLNRNGMLDREPPDHTRLRRLVSRAFTARVVEALRPKVQAIVDGLVDDLIGAGEADLIATLAEPLPVEVIAEMLGIPGPDRHLLRPWSADICKMYELNPGPATWRIASAAAVEFSDYLRALIRERRVRAGDDLLSGLVNAVDEGDRLTEDELIGTVVLLLNAGHEATVNATGNGWLALFRNPDQLDVLRAGDAAALRTGIEELLRYDTPLQMFERWVLDDIEVAGHTIRRGAEVALSFGVTRAHNPHITFGAGIHYCLGAPLGRLELELSFGTLLRRAPRLELAGEPVWKPGYVLHGLASLPVRCS